MQDFYTNTEADAGAWDRNHLEASDFSDAPTRAEAEADENLYSDWMSGPAVVVGYGVRCAHCRNRHETVADVRWCSDVHAEARAEAEAEMAAEAASERAFARALEARSEGAPDLEAEAAEAAAEDFPPATTTINHGNSGACEGGACSWHDKCSKHRAQDVANGDRLGNFRAYND